VEGILPNFFAFKPALDLVRLGRDNDGGYLVSEKDVNQSDLLIGLGINDDWSFESDFVARNDVKVIAYDGSISAKLFFRRFLKSFFRISNVKAIMRDYETYCGFCKFFNTGTNTHIQKFVGLNSSDSRHCTLDAILENTSSQHIFFKIDVEGSEYRLLHTLIENVHRMTGLVIEFHDCDIHLFDIEKFIQKFDMNLVHVHANNYSPIRLDDKLPLVLELTFSRHGTIGQETILPHLLDMKNNPKSDEIRLKII
jgi:hypothetical protein